MGLFYMINPDEQQTILLGINYSVNHDLFSALGDGVAISQLKSSAE